MKLKNNTAITAVFLVVMTLSAKVCGMLRDIAMAGMYGTGTNEAIAFSTASRIPLLFFDIALGSAVTSAFIPIFNEYLERDGRQKAIDFSNQFITLVFAKIRIYIEIQDSNLYNLKTIYQALSPYSKR